jgi:predicted transposase/invertase (TIGR01784 family)
MNTTTHLTSRYLDPKHDLPFKRVFGEHKHLLISFLNALLPLPADAPITSLEYLSPEQVPEVPGLFKNSIVDVKCVDAGGRTFIVEMQMMWSPSFESRVVFGASQAYVKQLRPGVTYNGLQPVYALALVNDVFDHATPDFYHHYKIVNVLNTEQTLKGLEFVFIELPKFKPETFTEKKMQAKWLTFMSQINEDTHAVDAVLRADADITQALELVEISAYTRAQIDAYHDSQDKARIEMSVMEDATAAGLAAGILQSKRTIAKELLATGMEAMVVSTITKLPLAEVQSLG